MRRKQWREAVSLMKQAVLSTASVDLCGHNYRVVYESRGIKEDRDYQLLGNLAQGKRCVFDVGANKGHAALVMSHGLDSSGRIFAFEASETACLLIEENARLNNLTSKIQVVNAVLSDQSGQLIDFYWDAASGGASIIPGYLGHNHPLGKVSLALDDFVAQTEAEPELIKIDVEGAEAQVLAGLQKTLHTCSPMIFLELHSWETLSMTDNAQKILDLARSVSYQIIYLRTKTIIEDVSILSQRGRCHVLLMPVGSALPEAIAAFDTSKL